MTFLATCIGRLIMFFHFIGRSFNRLDIWFDSVKEPWRLILLMAYVLTFQLLCSYGTDFYKGVGMGLASFLIFWATLRAAKFSKR